jgi:hypothetical protein
MVDGSLVPLYARPAFYGNVFFDRKSNYSMNVQVIKSTPSSYALQFWSRNQIINTPDLHILDFAVGSPGSQHDATAWEKSRVFQEHTTLLGKDEWVWADSAYPLRNWCQSPYKKCNKSFLLIFNQSYYSLQTRKRHRRKYNS